MAYYPQEFQDYPAPYYAYGHQPPPHHHQHFHHHHQHQHHAHHRFPPQQGYYDPQYPAYPPNNPYYQYPPYQGEGYPGYPYPPPPFAGAPPQQPQQPRAGDSRKGLNIVDPKEREQQRQAAAAAAAAAATAATAEGNVAPQPQPQPQPQPAPKKAALPIKDPLTKQPINIEQVSAPAPPSQPVAQPPQQPQPQQAPPQPAPQKPQQPVAAGKKKVIPILDPVTRKEVTAKAGAATNATASSSSTPAPTTSEPELPSSSSSATPALSTPRSVGNSEDAAVASQSSEEANVAKSAAPASPEALVFAPGATWGAPKLPQLSKSESTSSPPPNPKPVLTCDTAPGTDDETESPEEMSPSRSAVLQASRTGRRVYEFEFLLSVALKAPPPPEHLKTYEVYCPDARLRRISEGNSELKGDRRDRRGFGSSKASPTNYGPKAGPFEGDMRSKMGKSFVPGPPGAKTPAYDQLTNRADTAFNLKNSRGVTAEAKVLKKVRGILNKITPEKYSVLFEDLWQELFVDGQVDVSGIVEQVIHTVFDVALDQPKFSYLYADICSHLCRKIQLLKEKDEGIDISRSDSTASEDPTKTSATLKEFRRFLLNTCQARFEEGSKHQQAIIPADADPEERERIEKLEQRFKARSLGNIKFIAELFKRSLLSERIMHLVIKILLLDTNHDDPRNLESMETLYEMLNAVGKKLDRPQAKAQMDLYFEKLADIAQTHPIKRIRFLVLNMVELRKNNWVTRQDLKQNLEEDMRRTSSIRNTSWVGNGTEVQRVSSIQRSVSYRDNAPVVSPKEKDKQTDKDGFQVVGKPGKGNAAQGNAAQGNAWEKNATPSQTPPPKVSPQSPASGNAAKPKTPTTPLPSSPAEVDDNQNGVEKAIPPLSDEQVAAKSRGLLEEWANDPSDVENALAVLKEEIPAASYSQFLMGMLLCAISQNKREKERAELPGLCTLYAQEDLIQADHLQAAFLGVLQKAKRDEMWVDVPRLWKNVGAVLCGCLNEKVMELDALAPLCEALANEEDYPELPMDFMTGVLEAMKQEDMDVFDPDKASNVIAALGKKKKSKVKKVTTIEEFEAALEKALVRSS